MRMCVHPWGAWMICALGDTKNAQNARGGEGEARSFAATPLTAGHASVIGWSPEVGVQSGSCHSSEERSNVNFHRSSPFLPSPSGVLQAYTIAIKFFCVCVFSNQCFQT